MSACFHTNNVTCDNCRGVRFNLTPPSGVSSDSVVLVAGEGLRFRPEDALRITDESVLALRQRLAEVERERDEARAALQSMLAATGHLACVCYGSTEHGCMPECKAARAALGTEKP